MRKLFHPFALLLAICCMLISCTEPRYIYSASTPNNPYFKEKDDSKIAAYYAGNPTWTQSTGYNHGLDLQAAYAPVNHLGITVDYYNRNEKSNYDSSYLIGENVYTGNISVYYKRSLTSFGVGYFAFLNGRKDVTFNFYGGVGFGKFSLVDNYTSSSITATNFYGSNLTKWFVQPSFNFFFTPNFNMALIPKFSFVHYSNISTSYNDEQLKSFNLDQLPNATITYFEPTVNLQFVIPGVQWLTVEGSATMVTNSPEKYAYRRAANLAIGLSFDLSKIKKK